MSKADHMLSILWLLKSQKRITAKQLAEKLEINIRTVYRYIDALCASGVPIISDSGHNGGLTRALLVSSCCPAKPWVKHWEKIWGKAAAMQRILYLILKLKI